MAARKNDAVIPYITKVIMPNPNAARREAADRIAAGGSVLQPQFVTLRREQAVDSQVTDPTVRLSPVNYKKIRGMKKSPPALPPSIHSATSQPITPTHPAAKPPATPPFQNNA